MIASEKLSLSFDSDLTPKEFISLMFERTDEDGTPQQMISYQNGVHF